MPDMNNSKAALDKIADSAGKALGDAAKNKGSGGGDKSDMSKAVDVGLTALSQLDKSPEPITQTVGQAAKVAKKVKNEAENLANATKKMVASEEDEEVTTQTKPPIPIGFIVIIMIVVMLIGGGGEIPAMLVASPVNTVVSLSIDAWQEQDGFLSGETKQEIVVFIKDSFDWIDAKLERLSLWTNIKAKIRKKREELLVKKLDDSVADIFNPDDSEWDKTYKTIKDIEIRYFDKAFTLAKNLVVLKAQEDGLDVEETRKACEAKLNPNDPANYYFLYAVVDAYLLNQFDDYTLSNYDKTDTKSIENCLENAPSLASLCPFTVELKTKTKKVKKRTENGQEKEEEEEIQYYDPTFYPYSKLSCFEALGIDPEEEQPGFETMTRFEVANDLKYDIIKLQDENTTVDMGLDIRPPYAYEGNEPIEFLREDPDTGQTYIEIIPGQIVTYANAQEFIDMIGPLIQQLCAERGWTCAPYMIAQIGIETGWGKSLLSSQYFNYGGQKPGPNWTGDVVYMMTWEHENGVDVRKEQPFRAYKTQKDGLNGYMDFFQNSSYFSGVAHAKSPSEFANILVGGKTKYATDPNYAQKLVNTIHSYGLEEKFK